MQVSAGVRERPHLADHGKDARKGSFGRIPGFEGDMDNFGVVDDGVDCKDVIGC